MDVQVKQTLGIVAGLVISLLIIGTIVWGVFGFIGWNWDVVEWHPLIRFLYSLSVFILTAVWGGAVSYVTTK